MSEATKSIALVQAVAFLKDMEGAVDANVIAMAIKFDDFLTGTAKASPAAKAVAALTDKATTKKKPAAAIEEPEEDEEDADDEEDDAEDEDDEEGVTKDQVTKAIADLIDNDQRDEAIAILKKYKAKSIKGLDATHYEAVKKLAEKKLTIE